MHGVTSKILENGNIEIVVETSKAIENAPVRRIANFTIALSVPNYEMVEHRQAVNYGETLNTLWTPIKSSTEQNRGQKPEIIYLSVQEPRSGALLQLLEIPFILTV